MQDETEFGKFLVKLAIVILVLVLAVTTLLRWGSINTQAALEQFSTMAGTEDVRYTAIEWRSPFEARFDLLVDGKLRQGWCVSGRFQRMECWFNPEDG